jgi:hypothetical protein
MAVVFEHAILHEGAPVTSGNKYLCRSDVVYERYINTRPRDSSWKSHPEFKQMVQMYKDAAEWECKVCVSRLKLIRPVTFADGGALQGRVDLSSELYERALAIRQNQPVEGV